MDATKLTKYENQNGMVSNYQIRQYVKDNDMSMTTNFKHAIFLLTDGSLISGEYDYGERGIDHRIITGLISEGQDYYRLNNTGIFWKALQQKTKMVMLVPEANRALKAEGQTLSSKQSQLIKQNNYIVEDYI